MGREPWDPSLAGEGGFCEDVWALIGKQLRDIGAVRIRETRAGSGFDDTEVCFFSVSDKIIAIPYSPRDGPTCFIRDAEDAELSQYETWDTLWHVLGMDRHPDTFEGLNEYLAQFPTGFQEMIEFTGTCLVKYFAGIR